MKATELRKKTDTDLKKILDKQRDELLTLRFKIAAKEVKNNQLMRQTKKDIARVLTILQERSRASGSEKK